MNPVRLLARPLLASAYIANGIARVRDPRSSAESTEAVLAVARKFVDLPVGPETVARACGAAQAGAGALLEIGKFPRAASAVLVSTYVMDLAGDALRSGKAQTKEEKATRRGELLMRSSMLGGALLASVDTAGRPGLMWRAQHAAEDLRKNIEKTSAKAVDAVTQR